MSANSKQGSQFLESGVSESTRASSESYRVENQTAQTSVLFSCDLRGLFLVVDDCTFEVKVQ